MGGSGARVDAPDEALWVSQLERFPMHRSSARVFSYTRSVYVIGAAVRKWCAGWGPWGGALALAMLAGWGLRLAQLNVVEFKYDEATAFLLTEQMVRTGQLAQVSLVSSNGGYNPPLFLYVLAPAVWLFHTPLAATAWVAVLNCVAVALCGMVVGRYAGLRVAFWATLLYGLSMWAVVFSRKLWEQEAMAPFVVVGFWGLLWFVVEEQAWGAALALGACLWMAQLHPAAALVAPVVVGVLIWRWRCLRPLPVLAGAVAGVAPLAPYLVYGWQHRWANVAPMLNSTFGRPGHWSGTAFLYAVMNATGFDTLQLEGVPFRTYLHPFVAGSLLADIGVVVLGVGVLGCIVGWWLAWRQEAGRRSTRGAACEGMPGPAVYGVTVAWVAVPLLLSAHHAMPLYPHYFLHVLPVTFIMVGLGLDVLYRHVPRVPGRVGLVLVLGYTLLATLPLLELYGYLRSPLNRDFGYLNNATRVLEAAERFQRGGSVTLGMLTDRDMATVVHALLSVEYKVRYVTQQSLVLPPGASMLVVADADTLLPQQLALAGLPVEQLRFAGQPALAVLRVPEGGALLRALRVHPLRVRLANGVEFLGWVGRAGGRVLHLLIIWKVVRVVAGDRTQDYALYVHLMEGQQMVSQHDGMDYPSQAWRAGRIVFSEVDVPLRADLPPGVYQLRAGMYSRPAVRRVPRITAKGMADGEFGFGSLTLPNGQLRAHEPA